MRIKITALFLLKHPAPALTAHANPWKGEQERAPGLKSQGSPPGLCLLSAAEGRWGDGGMLCDTRLCPDWPAKIGHRPQRHNQCAAGSGLALPVQRRNEGQGDCRLTTATHENWRPAAAPMLRKAGALRISSRTRQEQPQKRPQKQREKQRSAEGEGGAMETEFFLCPKPART